MHRNRTWLLDPIELRTQRNRILPIEGGDGSTLSLDFTTGVLDPRLTFTRGSNATFINSSGLVQYAASNQLSNSVFVGAGGATGPTGWLVSFIGGTGNFSLSGTELTISNNGSADRARIYQTGPTGNGLFVTVQMKIVANNTGGLSLAEIVAFSINGQSSVTYRVNGVTWNSSYTGWTAGDLVTLTCIPTVGAAATCLFGVGCSNNVAKSASVTIKDVQIEVGTTANTYNPTTTSGAYYAPRFDYDPTTLALKGLLIEGSANNVLTNSNALTSSGWSQIGIASTTQSVSIDAPSGLKEAWIVEESTASGYHVRRFSATTTAAAWTFSFWAKAKEHDRVCLGDQSNGRVCATFVLTGDGTAAVVAGAGSPTNPTIVRHQNGWYRCSVTATMTAATSGIGVGGYPTSGTSFDGFGVTFTGTSGNGVYLYGFQAELGSGASSYIPTGASTGSRVADYCTMPTSSFITGPLYPQTLFVDCIPANPSAASPDIVRLFDRTAGGTFNYGNEIYYFGSATMSVQRKINSSSGTDRALASGLTYNTRHKFATAIDSSSFLGSYDGLTGSGATTSAAALASQVTHLGVGCNGDATPVSVMFGTVRQIKFFPFAMAQSQLNALTTL